MGDDDYVLSHTTRASERERLDLVEDSFDPATRRHLAALGIKTGWRCLEVGAGQGSIARWMAERVGVEGRVVATDINPRFLTAIDLPNVEVRQHDIRTDPLESGVYDLAHCRACSPDASGGPAPRRPTDCGGTAGWRLARRGRAGSFFRPANQSDLFQQTLS
jgi:SAM-dependent methyltransferase